MECSGKILRQGHQDTGLVTAALPGKLQLLMSNKHKPCVIVIMVCHLPLYNLKPMRSRTKRCADRSPAFAGIVRNNLHCFGCASDGLQFGPGSVIADKLQALRHGNGMRKDFDHFRVVLMAFSIREFLGITD
ncbi:hypothetical protein D3C75_756090 [compost metagenome]